MKLHQVEEIKNQVKELQIETEKTKIIPVRLSARKIHIERSYRLPRT